MSAVAVLSVAAPARAQDWTPDSHRSQAGAWLGWWSSADTLFLGGTVMPIVPFGSVRFADVVQLDLDVPQVMWFDGPGDEFRAGPGNPTFGARYAPIDGMLSWSVGGRLGVPLATIETDDNGPDDRDRRIAALGGAGAMALYDLHLWAPDYLPFGITSSVEAHAIGPLSIVAELEPTFYAALRAVRDFELVIQARLGLEARHPIGLGGGLSLPIVVIPTGESGDVPTAGGDLAQVSLDAFVGYTHEIFFGRLGNILALDEPLGFGFDENKVHTVYIKAGAFFDGRSAPDDR